MASVRQLAGGSFRLGLTLGAPERYRSMVVKYLTDFLDVVGGTRGSTDVIFMMPNAKKLDKKNGPNQQL